MEINKALSPVISGKFNISLTESNFQKLADKANSLVLNEDNLKEIQSFLEEVRNVEKGIDKTHKDGKEESLRISREWDLGKRTFLEMVEAIKTNVNKRYVEICTDIQNRQRQAALEAQRVQNIKSGIESNAIEFAKRIADCKTSKELTSLESKINLEKSRKERYEEFLPEAVVRFNELNSILAAQKKLVREIEQAEEDLKLAQQNNDEQSIIDLTNKIEEKQELVEEKQIEVQEAAINQSMQSSPISEATPIFPTVKARRSVWQWEIKDIKETAKKMPNWTSITPIEEKINDYLKGKKEEGINGEEFTVAGIRFFMKKTF
jgi:hypothetical protein